MKRLIPLSLVLVLLGVAVFVASQSRDADAKVRVPSGFFGVVPQSGLSPEDAEYMAAGGIESMRVPFIWAAIQPTEKGGYDWAGADELVGVAARSGLRILPSLQSPPRWVARKETTLPVNTARQRAAWTAFVKAAVARYGPGGDFWREHRSVGPGPTYEPAIPKAVPIREWQVWNESNFFYFTYPVTPARYAQLVTISSKAIKSVSPGAKVLLAGLFARPKSKGKRGMAATTYLDEVYKYPGIKARFDGVDLHPYALDSEELEAMVEEFHEVSVENHDRPAFYITEIGWGSEANFENVAFEQGPQGQVKQLRNSYDYLIENQRRLNLKQVYWFSWKDLKDSCDFCDSVGLFHEGKKFRPKPAWRAFVQITGGRLRP